MSNVEADVKRQVFESAQSARTPSDIRIAVLIPCYNEESTVVSVIRDFRAAIPQADIYVYDNNSTDRTGEVARTEGAVVRVEPLQGKGNVVRRMFADIDADVYLLVDGDDTYDPKSAPEMIYKLLSEQLDMVNGARQTQISEAYRRGHRLGNRVITGMVTNIFGNRINDMLSGLKVFSRRYVKSFPALSSGFEIETELTVHALALRMPIAEIPTQYKERPEGSESKLNTYRDGFRIVRTIIFLIKEEKPLPFFLILSAALAVLSLVLSAPIVFTYMETGLVPRFPTAILSTGLMLLAFLSLASGIILDAVTKGRHEIKRMRYLSIPLLGAERE